MLLPHQEKKSHQSSQLVEADDQQTLPVGKVKRQLLCLSSGSASFEGLGLCGVRRRVLREISGRDLKGRNSNVDPNADSQEAGYGVTKSEFH